MDWQRTGILAAAAVVALVLAKQWIGFSERYDAELATRIAAQQPQTATADDFSAQAPTNGDSTDAPGGDNFVPEVTQATDPAAVTTTASASGQTIEVITDVARVLINPKGGDIVRVELLDIFKDLDSKQPFLLLSNDANQVYEAQSGLIGKNGTDQSSQRPVFASDKTQYTLSEGDDTMYVDLNYQQGDVAITKRFTFERGDHAIDVEYIINNQSSEAWSGAMFGQVKRDNHQPPKTGAGFGVSPFLGAAITTVDENYKKYKLEEIGELSADKRRTEITGGWVAMVQHYFVSAWIPPQESNNLFTLRRQGEYNFLTFQTSEFVVPAGEKLNVKAVFYAGPKDVDRLEALAPHLDLTVDYGWLWWIAKPLFHLLDFIHGIIGSWGWSIVILTLIIKLIFFYPSAISYRSMAKMRKLQPMLADLKERYGDDRQKMSGELMKIYKKEKVNPFAGCLPMLIQMPVFISLYWMLMESVELRHAPFLGYIKDLSVMDPYFILPVLFGITMFVQQKLQPTPPDPMQAKIMQFLPIIFTVMFLFFPAGLVVYWVVNNTLSIAQQWVITRQIEKEA
ncbi:membrane protein insertase YidC [Halioxenophilus aromaticivorans]|uniref:Membrane protein insertase YidC n=1 Tax=Halioxenophilus aromaticivorans TaxID=1306992 RepID=A0AAV3U8Y4_9ALTE